MPGKLISIILALIITAIIGLYIPTLIDGYNNNAYGNVTIADDSALSKALQDAQSKGVLMGLYGWKDANYSNLTPLQAKETIIDGMAVFNKSGLTPAVFLSPDGSVRSLTPSAREAISSTGIPIELPTLQTSDSSLIAYGQGWQDMKSSSDPRYAAESQRIALDQPTSILLTAQDWNPYLKSLVSNYLATTTQKNILVRIDGIGVNTPSDNVNDMASLRQYPSVGQVIYAVSPAGVSTGNDATIFGLSVNWIMKIYWWYFALIAFLPLSFFIIWRVLAKNNLRGKGSATLKSPNIKRLVSVIIPAYNEEKVIGKCLEAVTKQDYADKMEIIILNDGSTDKTAEIISKYPVTLIDLKQNVGKASALNMGIKIARGDILVFSDSDSYLANNAISALVKRLDECPDAQIVAGNVFVDDSDRKGKLIRSFQMIEYKIEQDINRYLQGLSGKIQVCPGPLFAVRRMVVEKVQFSSRTVVEDSDFTVEALKNGMKIVWAPEAKVYTTPPNTVLSWYKQRKRWWFGNLQIWKLHKSWAKKNPWLLLNYFGFISSLSSIALLAMLPILILSYGDIARVLTYGLPYIILPIAIFGVCMAPFFLKERKLILALIPYIILYTTLKLLVVSYIYIRYITGGGLKIKFGAHVINAS